MSKPSAPKSLPGQMSLMTCAANAGKALLHPGNVTDLQERTFQGAQGLFDDAIHLQLCIGIEEQSNSKGQLGLQISTVPFCHGLSSMSCPHTLGYKGRAACLSPVGRADCQLLQLSIGAL